MKKLKILSVFLILMGVITTNGQVTISSNLDIKGVTINGSWKEGFVILKDGTKKIGETKGYSFIGNEVKTMKFRTKRGADVEKIKAGDCKLVNWGGTNLISLLKKPKKPSKGSKFYIALYYGKNVSVFFDPKAKKAGFGGLNFGEELSFLVYKNDVFKKVKKMFYRKQVKKIFNDNPAWVKKSTNKKWFKYKNIYEVAKYYDKITN